MKTLAKILFLLTILIGFYSCGSDTSEDPTPIVTTITPVVTMNIEYGNNSYIVFTLDKKYNTPTVIEFNSNLKSLSSITIPANTLSGKYNIGTTTTYSEYTITRINDIKTTNTVNVTTQECIDPKLTKYLNSFIKNVAFNYDFHTTTITTNTNDVFILNNGRIFTSDDVDKDAINRLINNNIISVNSDNDGKYIVTSTTTKIRYLSVQ